MKMDSGSTSLGTNIVSTFVDAVTGIASGLSDAVVSVFNKLVVTENGALSNLAIWGLVFGGIALAIGVIRIFTRKIG